MTLEGTPTIVTPAGVARPDVPRRGADGQQVRAKLLQTQQGVNAIVVLIHEGGQQNPPYANGYQDVNGCENLTGESSTIVQQLSTRRRRGRQRPHAPAPTTAAIGGTLVTSAGVVRPAVHRRRPDVRPPRPTTSPATHGAAT